MSDTAQLFMMAGAWLLVAWAIVLPIQKWSIRIGLYFVLIGIFLWEIPYGYFHFRKLCSEDGGFRVFEKIAPQDSVCITFPIETAVESLLAAGFSVVESRDKHGTSREFRKSADEAVIARTSLSSRAQYCITQAFVTDLPWRIQRNEYVVLGATDDHVAARFSDIVWYGTWWQSSTLPILGRGGECRHMAPLRTIATALRKGT